MQVANLLGKLKPDKELPKPFLALELTDDLVQAAVWQVENKVTEVVSLGIPVEWDSADDNEDKLTQAVDATISSAIEGLPQEPSEVIFGLPTSWTTKDGIDPAKLKIIKLVSKELELKPLGFVVVIDSLIRYLKMQEGTPSTSIMVQVSPDEVTLHLVKLGKLEATQSVGRSDDIATDVEEGISRFKIEGNLPSRIIVFDGMHNLEEVVQNLVSYDWQSKFKFLHLPKVENLPKDVVIRSIAVAGGAEVAKTIGFEITEEELVPSQTKQTSQPASPTPPPTTRINLDLPTSSDDNLVPATDLGFAGTEEPVSSSPPPSPPPPPPSTPKRLALPRPPKLHLSFPSKLRLPRFHSPSRPLFLILSAVFTLLALVVSAIWFIPHAKVTIRVNPKILEEKIPLTLSTTITSIDKDNVTIPAKVLETSVEGTDSISTTGKKTIGDPATGEVTLYNRTDLVKNFPSGTVISAGNLDFTLDDDVTVASASAGADYVNVPGKATVKVTAILIGEDGNLGEGTEFVIGDFSTSTYVGKNDSALSGGSSSEISVVSQTDIDTLIDNLSLKLAEEARGQLLSSSSPNSGIYILDSSLEIIDESFSAKVGQEASSVSATLTISVKGIQYLTTDVEELVNSAIQSAIPPGYVRTSDLPSVELSSSAEENEGEVTADAVVSVLLLPELDESRIQKSLRGLPGQGVESALSTVVGLESAHIEITPKFIPPRWKKMPRNPNNIQVSIESV